MAEKRKLLYFTNNDYGRDVEMLLPVLYFAERFLNCEVLTTLTPNIYEIHRQKPDCVVVANTIGAWLHFHIAREATRAGIPVFALVSEGNYATDQSFNYWGYNTDKKLFEKYHCCWSNRTRDFLRKDLPEYAERIVLCGGVGFDRYRLYQFEARSAFLERHGVDASAFKKIIGYAGWGFGKLAHPRGRGEFLDYFTGGEDSLQWIETQRLEMLSILRKSVEAHPETLFILKKHPTETVAAEPGADANEIAALRDYPNVLYLVEGNLHDIISVVDLWWVYDSTTAIEADMMGKQTLFIVPDSNFPRSGVHEGFPAAKNFEEVELMYATFFDEGSLPGYTSELLQHRRERIVTDTIGFADGYNHIRAAHYLEKTLQAPTPKKSGLPSIKYFFVFWILQMLVPLYRKRVFERIPWLRTKLWVFEKYTLSGIPKLKKRYTPYLDKFYETEKIEARYQSGRLYSDLFKTSNSR